MEWRERKIEEEEGRPRWRKGRRIGVAAVLVEQKQKKKGGRDLGRRGGVQVLCI